MLSRCRRNSWSVVCLLGAGAEDSPEVVVGATVSPLGSGALCAAIISTAFAILGSSSGRGSRRGSC